MAITYPSSPRFRSINFRMEDPTIVFRAQSGRRITRKAGGHIWYFTLSYPPMSKSDFKPVLGALAKARGRYQTFTVIPPNLKDPEGTQLNDTNVAANASAGSSSVLISGATASATFKAGDICKFSNHSKVYMVTDDATADGTGAATLSIAPPLIEDVTTAHTVKHKDVPFTVSLENDIQEITTEVSGYYRYELDVSEAY